MPIYMTARYQVPPKMVDACKRAIADFVEYIKAEEPRTKSYRVIQEIQSPASFVHFMEFENEAALAIHRDSPGAKAFVNFLYPKTLKPVEFTEYNLVSENLQENLS